MTSEEYKSRVAAASVGIYQRLEAEARREAERKLRPKTERKYPTEFQEQRIVCDWLKAHKIDYAANQEGTYHGNAVRGALQRLSGAKKGRPDLEIFTAPPRFPKARGVALEMKSVNPGARATPEQLSWLEKLTHHGWVTYVAHGADDAIDWLKSLGYGTRAP